MTELEVSLAGVNFRNDDGSSRQEVLGRLYDDYWTEGLVDDVEIELRPEPDNEHDPDAVAVWVTSPPTCLGKVGYVPLRDALSVKEAISEGRLASAAIGKMFTGRGAKVWAKLLIRLRPAVEPSARIEDDDGNPYDLYE